MAELQVLNGPLQWKTFKVTGARFLLGRKDTCHLVLKDAWVSREHAVLIETAPGEYLVQDLGSENGISVNGDDCKDSKLKHGDILRVGRTEMRLFHPGGDESGIELGELARRSTYVDQLPQPPEADMLDMTVLDPGGAREPRTDPRDRLRRLEKLFLEKEEDNSRLAAENAVLKRALAKGGLIDPATGVVNFDRLTTPAPRAATPDEIVPLVSNGSARITWPLVGGDVIRPSERADQAIGAHRLGLVGLGRGGVRMVSALQALGWNHVAALASDPAVFAEATCPHFALPQGMVDVRSVTTALEEHQAEIGALLSESLGVNRTLRLLLGGLGGVTGIGSISGVVAQLKALDPDAGCGVVLSMPSAERAGEGGRAAITDGIEMARRLQEAGKLRPFLVVDEARLAAIIGDEDREAGNATVAGALDALLRLPVMPSLGGGLDGDSARAAFAEEGVSSLGLSACADIDASSIAAAMHHALEGGWLCGSIAPSRGRVAMIVAMIGSEALVGDVSVVSRLESAVAGVAELLPQASIATGMYEDRGPGIRIVAWVGGLPFPENLIP